MFIIAYTDNYDMSKYFHQNVSYLGNYKKSPSQNVPLILVSKDRVYYWPLKRPWINLIVYLIRKLKFPWKVKIIWTWIQLLQFCSSPFHCIVHGFFSKIESVRNLVQVSLTSILKPRTSKKNAVSRTVWRKDEILSRRLV